MTAYLHRGMDSRVVAAEKRGKVVVKLLRRMVWEKRGDKTGRGRDWLFGKKHPLRETVFRMKKKRTREKK